jgi:rhodanese-related sulfurtransferase
MMGPFVPDLISDQLNLVVALLLGVGFGFVLEQAGFSSSRRLAGVFYGYDFTVLRVFFTAAITAMTGILFLGYFGLLDLDLIFVNPTWLWPAVVGGAIMGVGFILGGYCPGTSVCAAAIGKIDAMVFVAGGVLGVLAFGEGYSRVEHFYESTSLGPVRVYDSLGLSQGLFVFLLIAIAVAAFAVTTRIERRVAGDAAPSRAFPVARHVAAGAGVLALGILLLVLPDRRTELIARTSSADYLAAHPATAMEAEELAFRVVDRDPRVRIIDIRPAKQFASVALPGAVNVPLAGFFGKDAAALLAPRHVRKVIVANGEAQEQAGRLLAEALGYENITVLGGGLTRFNRLFFDAAGATAPGTAAQDVVAAFRANARADILKQIADGKSKTQAGPAKTRKVAGGC